MSDDTYCSVPSESSVDDIAVTVLLTAFHTSADPLRSLTTASRVSEIHALSAYPHCLRFNQDGSVSLLNIPGFLAKNRLPEWVPQSHTLRSLRQSLFCPLRVLSVYPESYQAFKKKHRSPLRTVPTPRFPYNSFLRGSSASSRRPIQEQEEQSCVFTAGKPKFQVFT